MKSINLPDVETAAAAAHQRWIQTRRQAGATSEVLDDTKEELMVSYDRLSETAKALVRTSVQSTFQAIQQHGLPTSSDIDHIADSSHERWIRARQAAGATSETLDDTKEELMRPFASLSEAAKDLTRNEVRAILELIQQNQKLAAS